MTQDRFTSRVHGYLRDGYGVEDIAIMLGCDVSHVRAEVEILRAEGRLDVLRGNTRWGPAALRLMVCKPDFAALQLTDAGEHA